jgi:hypothetical protein
MFIIHLPKTIKVGDTIDCRINAEPAKVTWRDKETLVIGEDDAREVEAITDAGDLLMFVGGNARGEG